MSNRLSFFDGIKSQGMTGDRVGVDNGQYIDLKKKYDQEYFDVLDKLNGQLGTEFEVTPNGSTFVGLDYEKVDIIRAAIKQYVISIQTELNKLNTDASNHNALKGQIALAASNFVEAVSVLAQKYVSILLSYSDKMKDYGEAMKSRDTQMTNAINSISNEVKNETDVYQEKYEGQSFSHPGSIAATSPIGQQKVGGAISQALK